MDWLKPANLVLALTLLCAAFIFVRAQLNLSEFLQDEQGRSSSARMFAFGAFGASTWVLMSEHLSETLSVEMYRDYLLAWSGAYVLGKGIEAWKEK